MTEREKQLEAVVRRMQCVLSPLWYDMELAERTGEPLPNDAAMIRHSSDLGEHVTTAGELRGLDRMADEALGDVSPPSRPSAVHGAIPVNQ